MRLDREGYSGVAVSRRRPKYLPEKSFTWFSFDLTSGPLPEEVFRGIEGILHVAGVVRSKDPRGFLRGNYLATLNLVKGLLNFQARLRWFLFLSSQAAAGPAPIESPKSEFDPPRPVSFYGLSKLLAEGAVRRLNGKIPWIILRPPAVYGPMDADFLKVFMLVKRRVGVNIPLTLSMVYVDDLIEGIVKSINSDDSFCKTFFIAHPVPHTIVEFLEEAGRIMGSYPFLVKVGLGSLKNIKLMSFILNRVGIEFGDDKLREILALNWVCSPRFAEDTFGFRAKVDIKEGLRKTIDWYTSMGLL